MTDERQNASAPDPVDASGQPIDPEQVIPPEQPPMDDASGGPTVDPDDDTIDDISTDDLSVQGGDA